MATNKNFFVFYPILLKLGEVVVHMSTTTSPNFNKIGLNKKRFICAHLMEVSSIKLPLSTRWIRPSTETYDFKMKPFWSECFYYIYGMHVSLCPRSCFEFESKAFVNCQGSRNRFWGGLAYLKSLAQEPKMLSDRRFSFSLNLIITNLNLTIFGKQCQKYIFSKI